MKETGFQCLTVDIADGSGETFIDKAAASEDEEDLPSAAPRQVVDGGFAVQEEEDPLIGLPGAETAFSSGEGDGLSKLQETKAGIGSAGI